MMEKITKAKLLSKIEDELSRRYRLNGEVWIATKGNADERLVFSPRSPLRGPLCVPLTFNDCVISERIDFDALHREVLRDNRTYGIPVLDEVVQIICQSIALKNGYYFDDDGKMKYGKYAGSNCSVSEGKLDDILEKLTWK
jgi:hypothetical protein